MKVRVIDVYQTFGHLVDIKTGKPVDKPAEIKKHVVWWCAGCGSFHGIETEFFNGDVDNPTIHVHKAFEERAITCYFKFQGCSCTINQGFIHWSKTSTHRMAGQSQPLQHEESWRDKYTPWDAKIDPSKVSAVPFGDGSGTLAGDKSP